MFNKINKLIDSRIERIATSVYKKQQLLENKNIVIADLDNILNADLIGFPFETDIIPGPYTITEPTRS